MAKKQDSFYFDNFVACAEDSCRAAQMLKEALTDFHPDSMKEQLDRLHEVEHSADMKKHDMLDHLAKEFLPPIEREDIVSLSQNIDNITDKVEDVMLRVYMNNVRTIEPNALKMTDIIIGCCEAVKELLVEFRNFKRSKSIKQLRCSWRASGDSIRNLRILLRSSHGGTSTSIWSGARMPVSMRRMWSRV